MAGERFAYTGHLVRHPRSDTATVHIDGHGTQIVDDWEPDDVFGLIIARALEDAGVAYDGDTLETSVYDTGRFEAKGRFAE